MNLEEKIKILYYYANEKELDANEVMLFVPKIALILDRFNLDNIELINLIDVLKVFNNCHELDKINEETINLIYKTIHNKEMDLESSVYLPIMIKHLLLSHNNNYYDKDYNCLLFLSEFEILLELLNKMLDTDDLLIIHKYNYPLYQLVLKYKIIMNNYKSKLSNEYILSMMISHLATIFYFNQEEYNYNYEILLNIVEKIIDNYQEFIDFVKKEDIYNNFNNIFVEKEKIEKEYILSKEMLDFYYKKQEEKKIKRK